MKSKKKKGKMDKRKNKDFERKGKNWGGWKTSLVREEEGEKRKIAK